jgi:hypothetical protein
MGRDEHHPIARGNVEYALSNPLNLFDPNGEEPRGERRRTGPGGHRANPGKKKPSYYSGRGGWGVKDPDSGRFKPLNPQPPPPTPDNPDPWKDHPDYKQDPPTPPDPSSQNQFTNWCAESPSLCAIPPTLLATGVALLRGAAGICTGLVLN